MKVYARALMLALAGGSAVWLAEAGHAHLASQRIEAAAEHEAVVIENEVDPVPARTPLPR